MIAATSTTFEMSIEVEGACVCVPESITANTDCAGICDPSVLDRARAHDQAELVLHGQLMVDGDSPMQVSVLLLAGGYDRAQPFVPQVRDFIAGYSESVGEQSHGLDDPSEPYDLDQRGSLPVARFSVETAGTTIIANVLFGTEATAAVQVISLVGDEQAAAKLADELVRSVRMPAAPPRRMHAIDTNSVAAQAGRLTADLVFVLLLIGLVAFVFKRAKAARK